MLLSIYRDGKEYKPLFEETEKVICCDEKKPYHGKILEIIGNPRLVKEVFKYRAKYEKKYYTLREDQIKELEYPKSSKPSDQSTKLILEYEQPERGFHPFHKRLYHEIIMSSSVRMEEESLVMTINHGLPLLQQCLKNRMKDGEDRNVSKLTVADFTADELARLYWNDRNFDDAMITASEIWIEFRQPMLPSEFKKQISRLIYNAWNLKDIKTS